MDLRIPPRMRNALRQPNCGFREVSQAEHLATLNKREAKACDERAIELRHWVYFQEREKVTSYKTDKKVWRVDDGETHHVVAETAEEAIKKAAECMYGGTAEEYREEFGDDIECELMAPDLGHSVTDEDLGLVIKTFAEWAEVCEAVVSTSVH